MSPNYFPMVGASPCRNRRYETTYSVISLSLGSACQRTKRRMDVFLTLRFVEEHRWSIVKDDLDVCEVDRAEPGYIVDFLAGDL
jgi:hypothetical protein